ncbi:MAG: hypothetical protein R2730_02425 [Chitinophagales bacterium]
MAPTNNFSKLESRIKTLQNKRESLSQEIQKLDSELRKLHGELGALKYINMVKASEKRKDSFTFETVILDLISSTPKTSKELFIGYKSYRDNDLDMKQFSSRLSKVVKRKSTIKIYVVPDNPIDKRFYYCKSEWFNGENLKDEYKKYIK